MKYSGSSYKFFEFWIKILPVISRFVNYFKKHLIINYKEETTNYLPFYILHYSTVLQSRIHRSKIRNKILIYLLFHFAGFVTNNSGARKNFQVDNTGYRYQELKHLHIFYEYFVVFHTRMRNDLQPLVDVRLGPGGGQHCCRILVIIQGGTASPLLLIPKQLFLVRKGLNYHFS